MQTNKHLNVVLQLKNNIVSSDTFSVAGELTYKLTLSLFPLLTFTFSLMGFLHLDTALLEEQAAPFLPDDISETLFGFVHNLPMEPNAIWLLSSIIVALITSTSGFRAMMRGINKAYGTHDSRSFIVRFLVSIALTLVFTAMLIVAIIVLILRNALLDMLSPYVVTVGTFANILSIIGTFGIMFIAVNIIYKMSVLTTSWRNVLPGSLFVVCFWVVSSYLFNFYVNTFPVFSLHGSIAAAFVLMIWLNAITIIMLIGAHINGLYSADRPHPTTPSQA